MRQSKKCHPWQGKICEGQGYMYMQRKENYSNGPIGRPKFLISWSILKTSTPKLTRKCALWEYGKKVLFTANPVQFPTTTGTFFMVFPTVIRSRITWGEVLSVRIISSRGITWAGLSIITSQLAIEVTYWNIQIREAASTIVWHDSSAKHENNVSKWNFL